MKLICNCSLLRQQALPLHVYDTEMHDECGYVELDFVAKTIDVGRLHRQNYLATPAGWHAGKRQYQIPSSVTGAALVELLHSHHFTELCETFAEGFQLQQERGEWKAKITAAAQEAEKQLNKLLEGLYLGNNCGAPWLCASGLFKSHTLAERWSGEPLAQAVERLRRHMWLQHNHAIEGDIEQAFLMQAYSDFWDGKKLDRLHVEALLNAELISDAEAAQWRTRRTRRTDNAK